MQGQFLFHKVYTLFLNKRISVLFEIYWDLTGKNSVFNWNKKCFLLEKIYMNLFLIYWTKCNFLPDSLFIARWLFLSQFWPLLKQASFFEAAGAVAKIGSSLWITNSNQVKLAQIRDTHCRRIKPGCNPTKSNLVKFSLTVHYFNSDKTTELLWSQLR